MELEHPKVGIVGGTGRMGAWFARFLEHQGLEVVRTSRSTELHPRQVAAMCDVVVISVPIKNTLNVIKEIGPLISENSLLIDLTSIKAKVIETMLKYSVCQVVGLHPLFGPESNPDTRAKRIAICPARGEQGYQWVLHITTRGGLKPFVTDPLLHDQHMGIVQGANHFALIAFALFIKESGHRLGEILNSSTQTFEQVIKRIRTMLDQPPHLFAALLLDNPYSRNSIDSYVASCRRLAKAVNRGQRDDLEELLGSLRQFFQNEEGMF